VNKGEYGKKISDWYFYRCVFPMIDGVVNVVDNYARKMSTTAEVYVFAPDYGKIENIDEFPYKIIRTKSIKIPKLDYRISFPVFDAFFEKNIKRIRFDIIHVHSPFAVGNYGIHYAKKNNIPLIATLHSQYKKDFIEHSKNKFISDIAISELMRRLNKCDRLIAVNEEVAKVFHEYGANRMPVVIRNATDLLPLEDETLTNNLREKYQIQYEQKVLLYVGRLDKIKNIDFLIDSLIILKKKEFKFKMIFIGSGPYEVFMKKKISANNLHDDTIFTGRIINRLELSAYYKLSDLFLFPSLYDTSSLVQVEAASQHTPTLFLEKAITASTINDGVNGYISNDSPFTYAETIIDIFNDTNRYEQICDNAFKDLYLTWDLIVSELKVHYQDLIENNPE
jgi:glycosyltransferase involved in cell wall biosynthesis